MKPEEAFSVTIPPEWRSVPFWSLFRRRKQTGFVKEELLSVYRDHGIIPKASRDDNHNKASEDLSNYQLVTEGALVTNKMKAWQGSIGISRYRGIVSPAYYVYEPLSRENDQYLHYLLRSHPYIGLYGRISKGIRVNQWDLEHEALRNIPIILPDVETQQAIADFLDRETVRIDQLIEKKLRLVELLRVREKAVLASLLNMDAKRFKLRHLGKLKNGAGFPIEAQGDASQNIGFFKVKHLKTYGLDAKIIETDDTVSEEVARRLRATVFPKGTIVFAKIGAALLLSRFSMLGRPACIDNNMAAFIPNKKLVIADYALLALSQIDMATMVQPGAVPSMSTEAFHGFAIPLPEIDTQLDVVEKFREKRRSLKLAGEKTSVSIARLCEFRSALITAAVTGQIDVNEWISRSHSDERLDAIAKEMEA